MATGEEELKMTEKEAAIAWELASTLGWLVMNCQWQMSKAECPHECPGLARAACPKNSVIWRP
jgi:hypothetical protein